MSGRCVLVTGAAGAGMARAFAATIRKTVSAEARSTPFVR